MKTTIRLTALAEITGRSRDTIRSLQNRKMTPWDDSEFADQPGYRQYTGFHALTLILSEMLAEQGANADHAAEVVLMNQYAINQFLDKIEAGGGADRTFIANIPTLVFDNWVGYRWIPHPLAGSAEVVAEVFHHSLESMGTVIETRGGRSTERSTGNTKAAVVSLAEAYLVLKDRAEIAGYVVDGRKVHKIAEGGTEEGAE